MKRQRCSGSRGLRITLLGIGAMNSPRYRRAGLLVEIGNRRIMIDGGPGAITRGKVDAWLVSDERCELMSDIRTLASDKGTKPRIGDYRSAGVSIVPKPVVHTSHPTYGYLIVAGRSHIVWAPEFFEISAMGRERRSDIRRRGRLEPAHPLREGAGGHASVFDVAREAAKRRVKRLVFAHVGRPVIRALEKGLTLPWGELGREGARYLAGDAATSFQDLKQCCVKLK